MLKTLSHVRLFCDPVDFSLLRLYRGHLMQRTDSLKKILMLGKIEVRRRTGTTEDVMVGWHYRLGGHEFEQALGVGDGQRSLVCCSP